MRNSPDAVVATAASVDPLSIGHAQGVSALGSDRATLRGHTPAGRTAIAQEKARPAVGRRGGLWTHTTHSINQSIINLDAIDDAGVTFRAVMNSHGRPD